MMDREAEVLERQAELRSQAASERERITGLLRPLRPYLRLADRATQAGRTVASHPEWIALGAAALTVARPRLVLRLAGRVWVLWRVAQSARRHLGPLLRRLR